MELERDNLKIELRESSKKADEYDDLEIDLVKAKQDLGKLGYLYFIGEALNATYCYEQQNQALIKELEKLGVKVDDLNLENFGGEEKKKKKKKKLLGFISKLF